MMRTVPMLVINLDSRPQRLRKFLRNVPAPSRLFRLPAVETVGQIAQHSILVDETVIENVQKGERRSETDLPSFGAVGCYLSHLLALRWLEKSKYDSLLVVEDDVKFHRTIPDLPSPAADITLLGYREKGFPLFPTRNATRPIAAFFGLYAYHVTKSGATKILDSSCLPMQKQIDGHLGCMALSGRLHVHGLTSKCAHVPLADVWDSQVQKHKLRSIFLPYSWCNVLLYIDRKHFHGQKTRQILDRLLDSHQPVLLQ